LAIEEQNLSKKHTLVAFSVVGLLVLLVSLFVFTATSMFDSSMDRQPRALSIFKKHSFTLEIYNNTNEIFVLENITFPQKSFANFRYDQKSKKLYFLTSGNIKINNLKNVKLNNSNIDDFLNIKFMTCKINREFIDNIKNIFNDEVKKGLTVILESKDDQSSIKFDIFNENNSYSMDVLQTSSAFIDLAPRNIHNGIDTFNCEINKNSQFIKETIKLIINFLR